MPEVVVLSAARTPYGRLLGSLADLPAEILGARAVGGALRASSVAPGDVERVFLGNTAGHALRGNPSAAAAAAAGLPASARAITVRAGCASGLFAIVAAAESILAGGCRIVVAGGFESSSTASHLALNLRRGLRLGAGTLLDGARHDGPSAPTVAATPGRSLAPESMESIRARIVPVEIAAGRRGDPGVVDRDDAPEAGDGVRRDAGATGSAAIADGAAAVVLAEKAWADERGLRVIARLSPAPVPGVGSWSAFRFIEADVPQGDGLPPLPWQDRGGSPALNTGAGMRPGHATGADGAALVVDLVALLASGAGGAGYALVTGGWGESAGIRVDV
ncbi:MAG: hypothetical protein HY049_17585 [Acidobacteria bacterium]|nr:hypothetical protein [Acidobacteriota bacterium]